MRGHVIDRALEVIAAISARCGRIRARGAMAQRLYAACSSRAAGSWNVKMRRGFTMRLPKSSAMAWIAAFTGDYDEDEIAFISRFIAPDSFVLDVGASFGFYAMSFATSGKDRGVEVIAVEPLPANLAVLRENVSENKLTDVVKVVPVALGASKQTIQIVPSEAGGAGNAIPSTSLGSAVDKNGIDVPMETLDGFDLPRWTTKARCSLVKMDIEGSEMNLLAGARAFLQRHRPIIFGEFNWYFMEVARLDPRAAQLWAEENSFRCFEIHLHRRSFVSDRKSIALRELNRYSPRREGNLLLVPSERADSVAEYLG